VSGCPVCRAGFRGTAVCPRCGADLARVMSLAVRAWRSRESARDALAAEAWASARELASQAQRLHDTPAGRSLLAVALCAKCP
jgi:predicted amidophosphoribosyltransferase